MQRGEARKHHRKQRLLPTHGARLSQFCGSLPREPEPGQGLAVCTQERSETPAAGVGGYRMCGASGPAALLLSDDLAAALISEAVDTPWDPGAQAGGPARAT